MTGATNLVDTLIWLSHCNLFDGLETINLLWLKPGIETRLRIRSIVNTMAADALASQLLDVISSHGMNRLNMSIPVFHEEGFQLSVSSQCWEMIENADVFVFLKLIQHKVQQCHYGNLVEWYTYRVDGLMQERRNSSALAAELRLSCTKPLMCCHHFMERWWHF